MIRKPFFKSFVLQYLSTVLFSYFCNLSIISRKNYSNEINSGLTAILQKTKRPWYLNIPNFNIFTLGCSGGYNVDYKLNMN